MKDDRTHRQAEIGEVEVVRVGGMTRMPKIQEVVMKQSSSERSPTRE